MTLSFLQNFAFRFFAADPDITLIDGVDPISADPNTFINKMTAIGLSVGIVMAVILISIGGYKMMGSKGDPKAIQDAQDQIQNAIMGFILIIAAVAVIRIILTMLGISGVVGTTP